jgi:hypothetical protein
MGLDVPTGNRNHIGRLLHNISHRIVDVAAS